jgi:glycosyltransferase involved in cell wall biosynthesis
MGWYERYNQLPKPQNLSGPSAHYLTPENFHTLPLPTYPHIRLAIPSSRIVERRVAEVHPDAFHIATEGPIGLMLRRYCHKRGIAFTTSFHTRFPDYISARIPFPRSWAWGWLRWFHNRGTAVMAATPELSTELLARGFKHVRLWTRGVDANLFRPRLRSNPAGEYARPVFLTVGRLVPEKNIEAFLSLDLPGTKVVVGDGPIRTDLERRYPDTVFLGSREGEDLAAVYSNADVFVFPSRTDTFGLVILEALASGVPIAAYPVAGPRDVIAHAPVPVGALDSDLRTACLTALTLSRDECRAFAL